jgi:hypothetical protein
MKYPGTKLMNTSPTQPTYDDDSIDLRELWQRLMRGLPPSLGLGALGLVIAAVVYLVASPFTTTETSTRVVFGFPGYERGLYPDGSLFQADDLRAPEVVGEALRRRGLESNQGMQSQIRAALTIEGIIPANVVKERDRLRAAGQTPPPYLPDEYRVSLSLPRKFDLTPRQREQLLSEIVSAYQERFQRTHVAVPLSMGTAFESLEGTDFFDYELVLNRESRNIRDYLTNMQEKARSFRSPRTNMSFSDLAKQNELFTQIRLNETLGLIRQNGLSTDRRVAMLKMDYYLRSLEDQEIRAVEEENLVRDLLRQAQERAQAHVLGVRSPIGQQRPESPMIDQGLVDSLLANDAYNFLVREALRAGLKTREIQSEKAILQERRRTMQDFIDAERAEQQEILAQLENSLKSLRVAYDRLMEGIRLTHEDFQSQELGNAVRVSMQAVSASYYNALAKAGIVGAALGLALGMGLSLLGVLGARRTA